MSEKTHTAGKNGKFGSRLGFILASVGSAVGMGNIWMFPYRVGQYGGAAFLIVYFGFILLFGLVGLSGEFAFGRLTGTGPIGSYGYALKTRGKKGGALLGAIPLIGSLGIAIGYAIIVGWVLRYLFGSLSGVMMGMEAEVYFSQATGHFGSVPWHFMVVAITMAVLVGGVLKGIEKVNRIMMPAFFILFIIIAVRVFFLDGALAGYEYLLIPRWELLLKPETWVMAMGQAFFSLSVGMGIMVTYGSYVPKDDHLVKSAVSICALDTMVAILAAFAIIPVVFATLGAEGLGMGGGFAFMALPEVFAGFPGGRLFGLVFFILLFFAALTSAISILESCVAFISEEFHFSRLKSTIVLSVPMTVLSAGYSLSQSDARGIRLPWFDFSQGLTMLPMNAVMEKFTDNLMIPLGALAFCLFVGWVWGTKNAVEEIESEGRYPMVMRRSWSFIIRFLAPLVIAVILYFTLGRGEGLS